MKMIFKKIIVLILRWEAKLVIRKYKPKIITITGSVGKTSTKDALYAVISGFSYVRKSAKSYNSEIGLPLTVLGRGSGWNNPLLWLRNILHGLSLIIWPHEYPKWLVLEVGVGKPGDMRRTASWLKSDAVVLTAIGETPVHIEFFNSRKHLIEEKFELLRTLKKDGLLVLNADDADLLLAKDRIKNIFIAYGQSKEAEVRGSGRQIDYDQEGKPRGIIFRVDAGGASLPVTISGALGRNYMYAGLAALAMAFGMKWNMLHAADRLKDYKVSPGRMRVLEGKEGSLLIDDTYNSSPQACKSALETLKEINKSGRKIAILGDMLELGKYTDEAHRQIGALAREIADVLFAVGPRAKFFREGALEAGLPAQAGMVPENIFEFSSAKEAAEFARTFIKENDIILIKGSQGMRLERVVEALLLNPEKKKELLVRQDKEWQNK